MSAQEAAVGTRTWSGAASALSEAWSKVIKSPEFLILYVVLNIIVGYFNYSKDPDKINGGALLLSVLVVLVTLGAYIRYSLAVGDGQKISLAEAFKIKAQDYINLILGMILGTIIAVLAALPILIPLIWVVPWLALMLPIIVDKHVGPMEAFKYSRRLTTKNKGKVWGIIGIMIVVGILIAIIGRIIPGVAGSMVEEALSATAGLIYSVALVQLYRFLDTTESAPAAVAPVAPVAPAV